MEEDTIFVMNEYVHPRHISHNGSVWTVEYEPLEHVPIVEGSLKGNIHDGLLPRGFEVMADGAMIGPTYGVLMRESGVIVFCYYQEPSPENYLCVTYSAGHSNEDVDRYNTEKPQEFAINWLQEGF